MNRLFAMVIPSIFLIMNLSMAGIMWVGSYRVDSGAMQAANVMAFIQYVMQILFSVLMATMLGGIVPRAQVAAGGRINDVLDVTRCPVGPVTAGAAATAVARGRRVRDVEFRYPGAQDPILGDISFDGPAGPDYRHRG